MYVSFVVYRYITSLAELKGKIKLGSSKTFSKGQTVWAGTVGQQCLHHKIMRPSEKTCNDEEIYIVCMPLQHIEKALFQVVRKVICVPLKHLSYQKKDDLVLGLPCLNVGS